MKRVMRRALAIGIALALSGSSSAWADVSSQGGPIGSPTNPIKTVTVTSDTSSAGTFEANKTILGFKLMATAANAICSLYDSAALSSASTTTMIDELREATANETDVHLWPTPFRLTTDLSVGVTNGICIVYYQ